MPIIFLHPDLGIGGAERAIVDAAVAVKCEGYDVEIITNYHDPDHSFEETVNGTLKVTSVFQWLPRSFCGRFIAFWAYIKIILAAFWIVFARRGYADIIFVDQISAPLLIFKIFGYKTIFYGHFPDLLLSSHKSWLQRFYRFPFDICEKYTTSMADTVLLNSRFTSEVYKNHFHSLGRRNVTVLYPVPNTENMILPSSVFPKSSDVLYSPPDAGLAMEELSNFLRCRPRLIFLSINRYERKKNIGLLFRAFALLKNNWSSLVNNPSISPSDILVIHAGGYDPRIRENVEHYNELQKLLKHLELSGEVKLFRSVPSDVKFLLIAASAAVVYTPANEHFGIVPIEAMYLGRPVIALDSGGLRETVVHEKTGFLCPFPENSGFENSQIISYMAEYMSRFVNDAELSTTMGKLSHNHVVTKFSIESFKSQLVAIFEETLSRDSKTKKQ